jgi:hypothetical protein
MSGRVFISHSSADKPIARTIATELRNRGISVWIDEESISVGSSIGSAIADGIDSADYFLLILSGKSVQSRWVHAEAEMAFQKSMEAKFPIIPVRIDGTPVPRLLKHLKYVDFRHSGSGGLEELLSFFKQDDRLASDRRKAPPSEPVSPRGGGGCVGCLQSLSGKQLRMKIISRYDRNGLGVIWFDLFNSKIDDDLPGVALANSVIELLDKAKRSQKFDELLEAICADHPNICP